MGGAREDGSRRKWWQQTFLLIGFALLAVAAVSCGASVYFRVHDRHPDRAHVRLAAMLEEIRIAFATDAANRARAVAAAGAGIGHAAPDFARILMPARQTPSHHRAYLINCKGSLAAAFPPAETEIPGALRRLVARFRAEPVKTKTLPVVIEPRAVTPAAETDLVIYQGRPAIAAVAVVMPRHAVGEARDCFPLTVATLASFDETLVTVLSDKAQVSRLRVATEPFSTDKALFSQADNRGRIVAWFGWGPSFSVWREISRAWPLFAGAGIAVLGFAAFAARRSANPGQADVDRQAQQGGKEDPLTHVLDRPSTIATLKDALARRAEDEVVVFASLNLDGFKEINGMLGYETGDQLLITAADRLRSALPQTASVGRFSGDEFAAVMPVKDETAAMDVAQACAHALAAPMVIGDHTIQISASVGLAHAPQDGADAGGLVRRADLALRAAKKYGRGRIVAFHHGFEVETNERRFIERELRCALLREQLDVAFQPIVAGDGLTPVGAEALLRWRHPTRGEIPPSLFVSVAEQTGMMMPLGRFVMRRALAAARDWPQLFIAINLSPVQVRDRSLVHAVAEALREAQIEPQRVVLEITEGVLIDNPEEAKRRLKDLRALGVRLALDDFGSGYSSLNYLRRLPIDKLKIDKEFVAPLGRSPNSSVIIEAIVTLGRGLGLSVLAEGVESEEQRVLLRLAGCDEMQGFLFARPMPQDAMAAFLKSA